MTTVLKIEFFSLKINYIHVSNSSTIFQGTLLYHRSPKGEGFNVYKNQLSWQTGSRNLTSPKTLPTIWYTYMTLVTNTHWTYMHIFRHIFLSNYWCQRSDIWSQASYRYPISWEAFFEGSRNLTGPKTLPTIWHTYMKLMTKYQIPVINSCWEKCDEKCAYMFNVFKNQLFFVAVFSVTVDGRNLIFGHKRHIGIPYCG
jgi:hypothetical protein